MHELKNLYFKCENCVLCKIVFFFVKKKENKTNFGNREFEKLGMWATCIQGNVNSVNLGFVQLVFGELGPTHCYKLYNPK